MTNFQKDENDIEKKYYDFYDLKDFMEYLLSLIGDKKLKGINMNCTDSFPLFASKIFLEIPIEDEECRDYIILKITNYSNDEYITLTINQMVTNVSEIVSSIKNDLLKFQEEKSEE